MKGLEFPCVFVVDVEALRFPGSKEAATVDGCHQASWLQAINRGAYQGTQDGEIRLFYTAMTRAERYLYVSGAQSLPQGKKTQTAIRIRVTDRRASCGPPKSHQILPIGLMQTPPRRRLDDADYPTSFTEVRYYLQCPRSYQFRERYGLNPVVPEMFGYGRTVHTSIQKLHALYPAAPPEPHQIEPVVEDTFHLKHVPQSGDPVNRPGAYENGRSRAVEITKEYVANFGADFERERQLEAFFRDSGRQLCHIGFDRPPTP